MSLLIQKSGILTTIQDLGRRNYARFGINPNGAMDQTAVRLINILLGNDENEAVLEMHFPAPEIVFEENAVFALGGANFSAELDGKPIENRRLYFAEKGNILKFSGINFGNRAYLSIRNGFSTKNVLGSSSTNLIAGFGGFDGKTLKKGDRINFNEIERNRPQNLNFRISDSLIPFYGKFPTVRITAGAEFGRLAAESENLFLNQTFTISNNSNRMGFRLSGKPLQLAENMELTSSAVNFGTIQLLPDGQTIILMADHQTSGGYPRLGNIVQVDLPLAAQLGAGDKIGFHLVNIVEAENLLADFENHLKQLKIGVGFNHRQTFSA